MARVAGRVQRGDPTVRIRSAVRFVVDEKFDDIQMTTDTSSEEFKDFIVMKML